MDAPRRSATQEYADWLERVRVTFEAVRYTCSHRLADPSLAEQVSVQVLAGLVARPSVFRYFGLPYSGRIARLAEDRIAAADAGRLGVVCSWTELHHRLVGLPVEHQKIFVATCVDGVDTAALAASLSCDEPTAIARKEAVLTHLRELVAPGLHGEPDPDERGSP